MSSEELFFQSLGINDLTVYQNYKIKEVLLDEKKREFNVTMVIPDDLIPQNVDKLYQACKRGINGNIKVNLTVESNITDKDKGRRERRLFYVIAQQRYGQRKQSPEQRETGAYLSVKIVRPA